MFNPFSHVEFLEPRCPGCNQRMDYGVTTSFNEQVQTHVCKSCGTAI